MAHIQSCSINSIQSRFLEEKHLSPSILLQEKINELMGMSHAELQTKLNEQKNQSTTKWTKRLDDAKSYVERLKIQKEWSNAMGFDDNDDGIDQKIKMEEERENKSKYL